MTIAAIIIGIVVIGLIIGAVVMYKKGGIHSSVSIDNYKKPFYIQSSKTKKYLAVRNKITSMESDIKNATQFKQLIKETKIPVLEKRGTLDKLPFFYIFGSSKLILATALSELENTFLVPDLESTTQPAVKHYDNFSVNYNDFTKPAIAVYDEFFLGDRPDIDSCLLTIVPA